MKTFVATLKSTSPLSFSRYYAQEVPKKDKESAADFEERTWRHRLHVTDDGFVLIPPFAFTRTAWTALPSISANKSPGEARRPLPNIL